MYAILYPLRNLLLLTTVLCAGIGVAGCAEECVGPTYWLRPNREEFYQAQRSNLRIMEDGIGYNTHRESNMEEYRQKGQPANVVIGGIPKSATTTIWGLLCESRVFVCKAKEAYPSMDDYYFSAAESQAKTLSAVMNAYQLGLYYDSKATYILSLRRPLEWLFSYFNYFCYPDLESGCQCGPDRLRCEAQHTPTFNYSRHRGVAAFAREMDIHNRERGCAWRYFDKPRAVHYNYIVNMIDLKFQTIFLVKQEQLKQDEERMFTALLTAMDLDVDVTPDYQERNSNIIHVDDLRQQLKYRHLRVYCSLLTRFYDECVFLNELFHADDECWISICGKEPEKMIGNVVIMRLTNEYDLIEVTHGLIKGVRRNTHKP